jgi:hypothetical protein
VDNGKRKFDFAELLAVEMFAARETFLVVGPPRCDIVRRISNTTIGTEERPCEIVFATVLAIPKSSAT